MKKLHVKHIGCVMIMLCTSLSLSACAAGGGGRSGSDVNSRVARLEDRVNTISTQIDGTQSAEVWSRMQKMENDLTITRNQMNDLDQRMSGPKGNQVMSANERLDRMEAALKEISDRLGIKVEALEQPYTPVSQPAVEQNYSSYENTSQAAAANNQQPAAQPGATQVVNSDGTVTVLINGVPQRVPVSSGATPGQISPQTTTLQAAPGAAPGQTNNGASADVAQNLYNQGIDLFNKYQYNDALICFKDFTDNYPDNPLVGNAWFWQGECSYQLKDYPAAVVSYQKVITNYSSNNKYVSSLLKQGIALDASGYRDQAKVRWNEITSRFPNTPEATRAKQLLAGRG